MSTQWSAVQSFQHSQHLLAAINVLSIHLKLELSGVADDQRAESAERARETLGSFFIDLEAVLPEVERGDTSPVLGAGPRKRQLVESFAAAKRDRQQFRSQLFRNGLHRVRQLLYSNKEGDQRSLLKCLEELRMILEEHILDDAAVILGEI